MCYLRQQIAFTLYRLPSAASDWSGADELVDGVVLPYALERAPRSAFPEINLAAISLGAGVLDPLVGFALLERRPERGREMRLREEQYRTTPLIRTFLRFEL